MICDVGRPDLAIKRCGRQSVSERAVREDYRVRPKRLFSILGEQPGGMNEPCFSVYSFPSFLYSRRFRNEVSDDVIIMGFPINKSPPPCGGGLGWGGVRRGPS